MKTDRQKLEELLTEFGVEYKEANYCRDSVHKVLTTECDKYMKHNKGCTGYAGFYTTFQFDEQGKFVQIGSWE